METNLAQGVNSVSRETLCGTASQWEPRHQVVVTLRDREEGAVAGWGCEAQRLRILPQSPVRGDSGLLRTSPEGKTAEAPGPRT